MLGEGKQELAQTDTGNNWNQVSRPFSLVAPRGSLLSLVEGHLEGPGRRNYHFIACPLVWKHFDNTFNVFSLPRSV